MKAAKESWITAIVALVTSINTILALCGINLFDDITSDQVYTIVSAVVNLIVMAVSYWRDHPWTEEACIGTGMTRMLKAQRKGKIYQEPDDTGDDEEAAE